MSELRDIPEKRHSMCKDPEVGKIPIYYWNRKDLSADNKVAGRQIKACQDQGLKNEAGT